MGIFHQHIAQGLRITHCASQGCDAGAKVLIDAHKQRPSLFSMAYGRDNAEKDNRDKVSLHFPISLPVDHSGPCAPVMLVVSISHRWRYVKKRLLRFAQTL
jgi:hypothetical protein